MVLNCEDPTFLWGKENGLSLGHSPQVRTCMVAVGRPCSPPLPRGRGKHLTVPWVSRNSPPPTAHETAKLGVPIPPPGQI